MAHFHLQNYEVGVVTFLHQFYICITSKVTFGSLLHQKLSVHYNKTTPIVLQTVSTTVCLVVQARGMVVMRGVSGFIMTNDYIVTVPLKAQAR